MNLLHPVHTLIKDLHSEGLQCHPTTSGRRIEYQRDILGWVTEVPAEVAGQMQSILSQIEYRADGQITAATFGNDLVEGREYDLQGRLTHQILVDGAGLIVDERNYTYDPAGNITARTGTPGDQHYNYDALDRLIDQDISEDGKNWQYDYGPNHNRQSRDDGDLLEELYSYQPKTNRLTEVDKLFGAPGSATPTSRQFIYNQANRFSEYVEDGESIATYIYNALGQRTRRELETETTLFHYETGIQLLAETDEAGNAKRDYVWVGSRPLAQIESTGLVTYLHTDHLLTPRVGTSDAQNVVWQWEGEAFGDIDATAPMEINLRFPGQYFDRETEHHYNYFREYAPDLGRYLQTDPIGLVGGISAYIYSENRPLIRFDKFGLFPGEGEFDVSFCFTMECYFCTIIGGCDDDAFREGLKEAGECISRCASLFVLGSARDAAAESAARQVFRDFPRGFGGITTGLGLAEFLVCIDECEPDQCP